MNPSAQRLAAARALVAAAGAGTIPPPPVHLVDQVAAAAEDAHRLAHALAAAGRVLDPDRGWKEACAVAGGADDHHALDEVDARLFAALAGVEHVCLHLRRGGPQPAFACLPLHRIDCPRCIRTRRKPLAGEGDRCDWCGARGVSTFSPLALQRGPLLVLGDACPTCATALGVSAEAAS